MKLKTNPIKRNNTINTKLIITYKWYNIIITLSKNFLNSPWTLYNTWLVLLMNGKCEDCVNLCVVLCWIYRLEGSIVTLVWIVYASLCCDSVYHWLTQYLDMLLCNFKSNTLIKRCVKFNSLGLLRLLVFFHDSIK